MTTSSVKGVSPFAMNSAWIPALASHPSTVPVSDERNHSSQYENAVNKFQCVARSACTTGRIKY